MTEDIVWKRLEQQVIGPGLCTACGTCVGLSKKQLRIADRMQNPRPERSPSRLAALNHACWDACPGKGIPYPDLQRFVFGHLPDNWLVGTVRGTYIGHTTNEIVRRNAASGGIITQSLLHLLETKRITGAIVLQLGKNVPSIAEPTIARTREEILASAQSVYVESPLNTILEVLEHEEGPLAFVGLPDQVAAIRTLQTMNHPTVQDIRYILGPYTGTVLSPDALLSFLHSQRVKNLDDIVSLRYRAGEWPGYLEIHLKDRRILRAEKFYYNYLIPFFITPTTLLSVDFTNELTDISVGDAWSPQYEKQRGGHSVILARSKTGEALLKEMHHQNKLALDPITIPEVLDMHGHMLDFKKRGSFIRLSRRRARGLPVPKYGYEPVSVPKPRLCIEYIVSALFWAGRKRAARWAIEHLPLTVMGPLFNFLRKTWKQVSKPTKRKGLINTRYRTVEPSMRPVAKTNL